MAAGDSDQDKTEDPTAKRREDAKKEGRIPRSAELTTAMVLLGAALVLNTAGGGLGRQVTETMRTGLLIAGSAVIDGESAVVLVQDMGWKVMAALATVVLSITVTAGTMAAVQARGALTMQPLQPKFERVNPLAGFKKFFGLQPWVELLKSLLKLLIVGVVVWNTLEAAWLDSLGLAQSAPTELLAVIRTYCVKLLMTAGLCYLAFAAADYGYQIWNHEKGLRMTKQEVKEESKSSEGDQMQKARLRAFGRSLARKQMMQEVPHADVVITNPTHIAVALKYDPALSDAPVVVAMGQRKVAQRIKEIAREHGVPMMENKPLARALLASARVGTAIPADLYLAVAEVLAWVISKRGRLRNVRA